MLGSRRRNFLPLTEFSGLPCLSCTAQRIKKSGPSPCRRGFRGCTCQGPEQQFSQYAPFPRMGNSALIRRYHPEARTGERAASTGKAARCHARRRPRVWSRPPGRAACRGRPGPASTRSVGGMASSDASLVKTANSEPRRRSSPRSLFSIWSRTRCCRPGQHDAGLPVPCADGTAGHATGIPRFPAVFMAFVPCPVPKFIHSR
jgi:hypothetical protein